MPDVTDENNRATARIRRLQARIDEALPEPIEEHIKTDFSPYAAHLGPDIVRQLHRAASPGGIEGLEAAMDTYDQLMQEEDNYPERLRYALLRFLNQHGDVEKLGLDVPSLQRRGLRKARPSDE